MSTTPLKQVTLPESPPAADAKEAKAAAELGPKSSKPAPDTKDATPAPVPESPKTPPEAAKKRAPEPAKGRRPEAAKAPAEAPALQVKPKSAPDPRATLVKSAPAEAKLTARPSTQVEAPQAAPVVVLPTTEPVRNAAAVVRALRRARARRLGIRVALGVGLPTILASIYFFLVASSQYESVSLFMVNSADGRASIGLESLIGAVPGAPATRDTLAVRDFMISRDMLQHLEQKLQLSKHYEDPASDWWARLSSDASSESVYDYYREMVRVDHDGTSGVVTLRVRAFSPEFAKQIADTVISESEKMVNQLSDRVREDQTNLAHSEVANAEARLTKARQAIVKLQQDHAEFNPEKSATEAFALRGELKGEMARARAELMEARAFMQPDAPRVVALEERVRSLSAQVSEESRRLVNPKGEKGLGSAMALFDAAMVEKEFAQGAYQSALTSLEVARSEAARQHRYLATISKPSQPTDETHPKRLRGVVTVVLLSAMVLGMAMLLVEAVREHARI